MSYVTLFIVRYSPASTVYNCWHLYCLLIILDLNNNFYKSFPGEFY